VATRLLLLRHAQSTWNATGRWQGWADPPLSEAGQASARAAALDPELDGVTAAISSDLERARSTAALIAAARGWPAVRSVRGLRERGAGDWTGLTREEIEIAWPGSLGDRAVVGGAPPPIPGGEPTAAVTARAVVTLHRVAEQLPGTSVLVVSHGALIRLVEQHVGGDPAPVPNLGGRWVEVSRGRILLGPGAGPLANPTSRPLANRGTGPVADPSGAPRGASLEALEQAG